jgi:hypothetical protein
MMSVSEMTRKELDAVPYREDWSKSVMCKSIVILPGRIKDMHDSGYRFMDFVAVDMDGNPICRLSGCSDVVHIEGIGGYGEWTASRGLPHAVKPRSWSIDCLPKSGLLQLFPGTFKMKAGASYSSFEIYAVDEK